MSALRCGACGHVLSERAWRSQAPAHTLSVRDLRDVVVAWPEGAVIEVRACPQCGRGIARMVRKASLEATEVSRCPSG